MATREFQQDGQQGSSFANVYFQLNPDVAASYAQNTYGLSPDAYAQIHWERFGQFESRIGPSGEQPASSLAASAASQQAEQQAVAPEPQQLPTPTAVYYDSDQGYFTSANAEQQIAKLREKYPDWEITPMFTEVVDSEGQVSYAEPVTRFQIRKAIEGGLLDIRLLDTQGNETYREVERQQGFLQSPVVGILASAVVPGLGEFFAAQLAAAGALTGTAATVAGNALAKIAVDVATGKDLGDSVRDVALSTAISAGLPNIGIGIQELVSDPNIAKVLQNAGTAAVTAAVQGKSGSEILTSAIAAGAGTAASIEGGATAGRAVQSLITSGGNPQAVLAAVGSDIASRAGQAVSQDIRSSGVARLPSDIPGGATVPTLPTCPPLQLGLRLWAVVSRVVVSGLGRKLLTLTAKMC